MFIGRLHLWIEYTAEMILPKFYFSAFLAFLSSEDLDLVFQKIFQTFLTSPILQPFHATVRDFPSEQNSGAARGRHFVTT